MSVGKTVVKNFIRGTEELIRYIKGGGRRSWKMPRVVEIKANNEVCVLLKNSFRVEF